MTDYLFLPWVRSGAASAINTPDRPGQAITNRAAITAAVRINQQGGAPAVSRSLLLYGPGDVTGFDARQVIRAEPVNHSNDFEPNYFASIEFDRPDFPWLFTPASPGDHQQLRPWICLIAVRKREGVSLQQSAGGPLPVLTIDSPANPAEELPDLSESWAWAHAQVSGALANAETLAQVLQEQPNRTLSRLICPRQLTARAGYFACVVPAFLAGVQAGLGLPATGNQLTPAWDRASLQAPLKLPVYYHWEFMAGAAGDFESLVWLLQRQPPPPDLGKKPLAVQPVIYQGAQVNSAPVDWQGALRPISAQSPPVTGTASGFQDMLRDLLNQGLGTGGWTLPEGMPVPPPAYGSFHAAQSSIPAGGQAGPRNRSWLRTLNLEVRSRAAAGIGADLVRERQESLMASAWEQLGEVNRANQLLRQGQMAREASTKIYEQHLEPLPAARLAALAGPVLARVSWGSETAYAAVSATRLPAPALQGAFRRLTRPRGALARRMGSPNQPLTARLIQKLADGSLRLVPPHAMPEGTFTDFKKNKPDAMPAPDALCDLTPEVLDRDALVRDQDPAGTPDDRITVAYQLFRSAATAVQQGMAPCDADLEPILPAECNLEELKTVLVKELDPRKTVPRRVLARLRLPRGWAPEDPLEPVMAYPVFPQPMYQELVKLSQDFLLPGVGSLLPNTLTLLETNPEFVEAFMVGLNYEMARELLWRGYPTDQRGSYFRQFWDASASVIPPATREQGYDIKAIDQWGGNTPLGGNRQSASAGGLAVLLIRGDLLRRYPRAQIYAVKARFEQDAQGNQVPRPTPLPGGAPGDPNYPEQYPIFQGTLPPDITFLGFPIASSALAGSSTDPGYFIVVQQPPTEPRYGLDETAQPIPGGWDTLSWQNVSTTTKDGYIQLSGGLHQPDGALFPQPPAAPDKDIFWSNNANSAHLAYITLQKPLRVMIHASDLI